MTPEEAPTGTIVVIGHPTSGMTARKASSGKWFYTHYPHRSVSYDDIHQAATLVYAPGYDLPSTVIVQHLKTLPWGQDEPINGGDLVDMVGRLITLENPLPSS